MASVILYGASDDLAEVEGDIRDEFQADCYSRGRWIFDTGTTVDMWMDDHSDWKLQVVNISDRDTYTYGRRPDGNGSPLDMSVQIDGPFTEVMWVRSFKTASVRA